MPRLTDLSALALLLAAAVPGGAATLTVTGRNDAAVDRPNLQQALDAAAPGDTILLDGTFQLDGVSLFLAEDRLTLEGRVIDDDGDGRANEDWADGADNDGDGAVDEDDWDAALLGVDDGSGGPAGDVSPRQFFNRALRIEGVTGVVRQIAVRHLLFARHNRAVSISADHRFGSGSACEDVELTGGLARGITIEHNRFLDNERDVQLLGAAHGVAVRDNVMTGATEFPVLLAGESLPCLLPDNSRSALPVGRPENTLVAGNRMQGLVAAVFSSETGSTKVQDNDASGDFVGFLISDDVGASLLGNRINGGVAGILLDDVTGAGGSSSARNNRVTGALFGVLFSSATGDTAANNELIGSGVADVLLDVTSAGNTVVATDFATAVIDLGSDNRLLGTLAREENASARSAAAEIGAAVAEMLGALAP